MTVNSTLLQNHQKTFFKVFLEKKCLPCNSVINKLKSALCVVRYCFAIFCRLRYWSTMVHDDDNRTLNYFQLTLSCALLQPWAMVVPCLFEWGRSIFLVEALLVFWRWSHFLTEISASPLEICSSIFDHEMISGESFSNVRSWYGLFFSCQPSFFIVHFGIHLAYRYQFSLVTRFHNR